MSDQEVEVQIGDLIDGRYQITGILGRGGMGQVYSAEHVGIKRGVAIKLLHRELRDDKATSERIVREAFAIGRLDHPNCVTITDSGTLEDGTTYLVMELLKGRSLGDELDIRGTLPLVESLHIARQVLLGLAHAHSVGVVHRDLKPDNIFLVQQGPGEVIVKILDFGIAKLLGEAVEDEGGAELTQAGMAIGSPTYMSPEQATGGALDERTDIYSLALVLYEMVTGEPPFYEEDDKLLSLQRRLKEMAPPMVSPSGTAIPIAVDLMVRAALVRDVEERTSSAQEFLEQIDVEIEALKLAESRDTPASVPLPKADAELQNALRSGTVSRSSMHRLPLVAAGLVALMLVGFFLFRSSDEVTDSEDQVVLDMPPDYFRSEQGEDPSVLAERLETELVRLGKEVDAGRGARHLKALQRLQSLWTESSRTNRLLGLAYMEKRYWQDGLKFLRKALVLDPSLRRDPTIIKSAIRALTSKSKPGLGLRFLVRDIGSFAIPLLEETSKGGTTRQQDYAKRALKQISK